MTRSKIILIVAGTLGVLLLFTGVHFILSPSHVDGTVPATAPSGAPIPEGPRSTAPATQAPSAAPIRVDGAVGQANPIKQSTSADPSVYRPGVVPAALEHDRKSTRL